MRIWPVVLDGKPGYMHSRALLTAPLGVRTVFEHLAAALAAVTENPPIVIASDASGTDYETWIREACPGAEVVRRPGMFASALAKSELSDALLYVDPRWTTMSASQLARLVREHAAEPRVSHHLVVFERATTGTKERVCFDESGGVRGIQRHYEPTTWPFIAGVAATLVPCSCGLAADGVMPRSILELRHLLFDRGVPTRDVPFTGNILDLGDERGLLAANEQLVLRAVADRGAPGRTQSPILVGRDHLIHPTARVMGPVVVHGGVCIEADAMIIGPTVIANGGHVGAGAVVAHAVIGPACTIGAAKVVCDRAWFRSGDHAFGDAEYSPVSYSDRLARVAADLQASGDVAPESLGVRRSRYRQVKRAMDILGALAGLILLCPVVVIIAAAIWLESRGPVFYGDSREGRDGRRFKCWKFRTMYTGAHLAQRTLKGLDHTDGPHFKIDRDPRVTRTGRVLRGLNLDEIPQLMNVLLGDMSLVGPRPSPFRENQVCVPWRTARLSVRPGITGFWQLCRHNRAAGDFHQWIEYDLLYVQHLTLMLDLKILAGTLVTLGGKIGHVSASWLVTPAAVAPELPFATPPIEQHETEQVA